MEFFKTVERFFEKHIEGFFRQRFATGVQPVEIGKKLVHMMEDHVQVGVSKTYAPNKYIVYLHPADLERMYSLEIPLAEELSEYIYKQAQHKGYVIADRPIIELREDGALAVGELRVEVNFTSSTAVEGMEADQQPMGTQVFEGVGPTVQCPIKIKAAPCARLRIADGVDKDKEWELGTTRIYIGRRETNEIPLGDISSSRVHAYIELEGGKYVLHDAKSLNGTYVNNIRIVHKVLEPGDRIKIGHTILVYEVM